MRNIYFTLFYLLFIGVSGLYAQSGATKGSATPSTRSATDASPRSATSSTGTANDTVGVVKTTVLVIPYLPAMHLSDADQDISDGSGMDIGEMRATLRKGMLDALNKNFAELYTVPVMKNDFVSEESRDMNMLYHSVSFGNDSTYPLKNPKRFAVKDSTTTSATTERNSEGAKKQTAKQGQKEMKYINVSINDEELIPDFAKKYKADYFIFLNEIDIKTRFDDCMNLALKIYRRDFKVHYSIFDRYGKQIYGDVAVSHFDSNTNDVKEIGSKNFPVIADYILQSLKRSTN